MLKTRETDGREVVLFGDEVDFLNKCKQQYHSKMNLNTNFYYNCTMGKSSKLGRGEVKVGILLKGEVRGRLKKM